jgi:hypothetical protein
VLAFDDAAKAITLATADFTTVHGVSVADPRLSRTVGVAYVDVGTTEIYTRMSRAHLRSVYDKFHPRA